MVNEGHEAPHFSQRLAVHVQAAIVESRPMVLSQSVSSLNAPNSKSLEDYP